jgi:hypothetical protein
VGGMDKACLDLLSILKIAAEAKALAEFVVKTLNKAPPQNFAMSKAIKAAKKFGYIYNAVSNVLETLMRILVLKEL